MRQSFDALRIFLVVRQAGARLATPGAAFTLSDAAIPWWLALELWFAVFLVKVMGRRRTANLYSERLRLPRMQWPGN